MHLGGTIPGVRPVGADWILTTAMPGTYHLKVEAVRSLPTLDWAQFLRTGPV